MILHPQIKSKNILKVIQKFESILHLAPKRENLQMISGWVPPSLNECGSSCCHGGWYVIATVRDRCAPMTYNNGVDAMEADLELEKGMLRVWSLYNSMLWGNEFGHHIFDAAIAFHSATRPHGAQTLEDIVDHWKEVYERVKATEPPEEQVVEYKDITAELAVLPKDETSDLKQVNQPICTQ